MTDDSFVHPSSYIEKNVEIGEGTKIWYFNHIRKNVRIGKHCIIGQNVMVDSSVEIGSYCKIQNNVSLYSGIILEDGVFCGPSVVFTNVKYPRAFIERKNEFLPTIVKMGTTIGANATIVCGITLGAFCFIGAGAVITKNVKPFALMVGSPAKQIGWVSHAGEPLRDDLTCPREKRRYQVKIDEQSQESYLEEINRSSINPSEAILVSEKTT